jgi:hypothetical protein
MALELTVNNGEEFQELLDKKDFMAVVFGICLCVFRY